MKNTIHYVLILDRSGSMELLKNEVISSFNEQVEMIVKLETKEPDTDIKITLCTFNDTVEFKFIAQKTDRIKKLTANDYHPNSNTALYDAIGSSFLKVGELVVPDDQVFFAIFTDGLENASKFYSAEDISYKINTAGKNGWAVKFFCRYEERLFYKTRLEIPEEYLFSMTLDKEGFAAMENQVRYNLNQMIHKQNMQ
ncbi:MAG: hypothetical protein WCP85_12615 [Mariniphaga sp.]